MKTYLVAFVAVLVSIVACQANTPVPVTPADDAGCTQAALEAKKCPPCTCGDAGTVVVTDAGPVVIVTDAGSAYDQACVNLSAIGCSAGKAKNCADRMRQATIDRLVRGPDGKSWNHDETGTACLLKAKDSKTAEACGFVKCN